MSAFDVVVVGSYVQDHAWLTEEFPCDGETRLATGFNTGAGGKGFNQAIACHRQGVSTCFLGAIGDDALAANARRFAADDALSCAWDVRGDAPTAASSILVNARGENRIVVSLGANAQLDAGFIDLQRERFTQARVVLTQVETGLGASRRCLELAREHGAIAILNPAPIHPGLDRGLLALADLITPNETEFAFLLAQCCGHTLAPEYWTRDDATLHAWCRLTGVATVVLTLGKQGCFVSHAPGAARGDAAAHYRVAAEPARVLDTTGAGDAFSGGLAAGLVRFGPTQAFRRAVVHANRVAAMSTEIVGTAPAMPTWAQVEARFGA